VNRLTKQISLVLISSSLVLHGCHSETPEEELKKEGEKTLAGAPGTTGYHGGHYHRATPFLVHSGSSGSSRVGASSGTGSGARSGAGVSARGGFGGSSHGVSS
jgi:hypothetical protein